MRSVKITCLKKILLFYNRAFDLSIVKSFQINTPWKYHLAWKRDIKLSSSCLTLSSAHLVHFIYYCCLSVTIQTYQRFWFVCHCVVPNLMFRLFLLYVTYWNIFTTHGTTNTWSRMYSRIFHILLAITPLTLDIEDFNGGEGGGIITEYTLIFVMGAFILYQEYLYICPWYATSILCQIFVS